MVTAIDWQVSWEVGVMGTRKFLKESESTVNLSSYGANMQVSTSCFTLQQMRWCRVEQDEPNVCSGSKFKISLTSEALFGI